jgi:hypothetical protein
MKQNENEAKIDINPIALRVALTLTLDDFLYFLQHNTTHNTQHTTQHTTQHNTTQHNTTHNTQHTTHNMATTTTSQRIATRSSARITKNSAAPTAAVVAGTGAAVAVKINQQASTNNKLAQPHHTDTASSTTATASSSTKANDSLKRKRLSSRIVRHQLSSLSKISREQLAQSLADTIDTTSIYLAKPTTSDDNNDDNNNNSGKSIIDSTPLYSVQSVHADTVHQQKRREKAKTRRMRRRKVTNQLSGVKLIQKQAKARNVLSQQWQKANLQYLLDSQ